MLRICYWLSPETFLAFSYYQIVVPWHKQRVKDLCRVFGGSDPFTVFISCLASGRRYDGWWKWWVDGFCDAFVKDGRPNGLCIKKLRKIRTHLMQFLVNVAINKFVENHLPSSVEGMFLVIYSNRKQPWQCNSKWTRHRPAHGHTSCTAIRW